MSIVTIEAAVKRIAGATDGQELAVFRVPEAGRVRCVFARTVATLAEIESNSPALIGVFCHRDDMHALKHKLTLAAR